jgi:hypothetical protein
VSYAEVRVTPFKNSIHETRTDVTGHFVLTALPSGPAQMNVRRLGFYPFNGTITIGAASPDSARLVLYVASAELAAIEIREESLADSLAPKEFSIRKRTNHFGRYMNYDDIEKKNVTFASELFRGIPGVTLQKTSRLGCCCAFVAAGLRCGCGGPRAAGAEVDELV